MKFLNVEIPVKNLPELDSSFVPLGLFFKEYQKGAKKPLCIAVERSGGQIGTYETKVYGTPDMAEADAYYVDRLVKFLLWSWGGFKVSICGDDNVAAAIRAAYSEGGSRAFDKGFMEQVYETEFIVESLPYDKKPEAVQRAESIGRHLDGGRIGFDAGGSDRQVSAVLDGEPIYSEEVVWFPKTISNPDYHFEGIMAALSTAAAKILEKGGHVDAIGVVINGEHFDSWQDAHARYGHGHMHEDRWNEPCGYTVCGERFDTLEQARAAVARIVGRDTAALSAGGVTKAAVETVAENFADGVAAPMFYMLLGGAPLALCYKAVNTMDSMVGYKNERYLYFGRAAAKLDDAANYLPARMAALLLAGAAALTGQNARGALRIGRRDRRSHASPNSAQTEAVMAGALGVQLAGYFGKLYEKPTIGDALRPVEPGDILRANRMLYAAGTLCMALLACARAAVCLPLGL